MSNLISHISIPQTGQKHPSRQPEALPFFPLDGCEPRDVYMRLFIPSKTSAATLSRTSRQNPDLPCTSSVGASGRGGPLFGVRCEASRVAPSLWFPWEGEGTGFRGPPSPPKTRPVHSATSLHPPRSYIPSLAHFALRSLSPSRFTCFILFAHFFFILFAHFTSLLRFALHSSLSSHHLISFTHTLVLCWFIHSVLTQRQLVCSHFCQT